MGRWFRERYRVWRFADEALLGWAAMKSLVGAAGVQ